MATNGRLIRPLLRRITACAVAARGGTCGTENVMPTKEMAKEASKDQPPMDQRRPVDALSFEEALKELEEIVRGLEGGQGQLAEAISAYERGTLLRRHCEARLAEAEARVEAIVATGGTATGTRPFGETA
jgi:exodeoxyribonuclease VII small subunit